MNEFTLLKMCDRLLLMDINTTPKVPTREVVEQFLAALKEQRCLSEEKWKETFAGTLFENGPQYLPEIRMDFDWLGHGGHPSIIWEDGGPYEWAYLFPFGGRDEEFGGVVKDVSDMLPKGWYAEAITSWAIGIYEV